MNEYSFFIFILHIGGKFPKKRKRFVMRCAFECFQSHCHIFKESYEFLCMMGALTIFGESFIFSFVTYRLITKSLGVGCTFKKVVLETKDECRSLYN